MKLGDITVSLKEAVLTSYAESYIYGFPLTHCYSKEELSVLFDGEKIRPIRFIVEKLLEIKEENDARYLVSSVICNTVGCHGSQGVLRQISYEISSLRWSNGISKEEATEKVVLKYLDYEIPEQQITALRTLFRREML